MAKISVLGAGSWGTALALLCHKNGHEVTIWSIMKDEVEMLRTKRQHETKLPGDNNIKRKAGTREQTSGSKDS